MKLPVVGATYTVSSRVWDAQRCVNFFPEQSEIGTSKEVTRLRSRPGLELFKDLGGGPIRGCLSTAKKPQRTFWVSGELFYEVDALGNETLRGTLNTQTGIVSLAENGLQILLVDGTNGYVFTLETNQFEEITDENFPNGATVCDYQDTYFLVNDPDTSDFYISANNDGTTWAAIDKTSVESSPDNLVSLLSDHGEVFLAGPNSVEIYVNTGNADFPFERQQGAVMQVGIAAAHTLKSFDNSVIWVSEDALEGGRFVYIASGSNRPTRVSNQAVERALESIEDVSAAYGWVYRQEGHEFYMLQVPGLSSTWVLDAATKMWHEQTYWSPFLSTEQRHLGQCHTSFNGKHLIGDRTSGKIFEMRLDVYSDNGDEIRRVRITPHLSDEMNQTAHYYVHLDIETGVGLVGGDEPQVAMSYSDDGGRTFGDERLRGAGKIGEYTRRVRWNRCGMARDRVYKFVMTDPVPWSITGAYAELGQGIN